MACLKGPLKGNNGSHSYQHVFRTTIVSHLIYTFHCIFSSRTLTFLGLCLRRDKTATLFLASPYQITQLFKKYFRTHPLKRNRQYRCFLYQLCEFRDQLTNICHSRISSQWDNCTSSPRDIFLLFSAFTVTMTKRVLCSRSYRQEDELTFIIKVLAPSGL